MHGVALKELNVHDGVIGVNINKSNLADIAVEIHKSILLTNERYCHENFRHYYITPANYLEFLNIFLRLLIEK